MAVFCVDENSELVTFSEFKLGQVSVLMCNWLRPVRGPPFYITFLTEKVRLH